VLQADERGLTMIFARTKRTVQRVADDLAERGFAAAAVHGDLGQGAREQALRAFRSGKVDVLVATDVAARGIDVSDVTHVVNYQCPEDSKTYVHRIGRTGRAGKEGVAVTLVDWDEIPRWKMISDDLDLGIDEPVETYSTSDHLYSELSIPTSATGRLPRSKRTRPGLEAEYIDTEGDNGSKRRSGRSKPGARRAEDEVVAPRRPRRSRVRTRSRGGVTLDGGTEDGTAGGDAPATEPVAAAAEASAPHTGPETGPRADSDRPRRRRRRGGTRRQAGETTGDPGGEAQDAAAS
jgi:superfamily II DNA/RNA helicase